MEKIIILGIDQGLSSCGLGVIEIKKTNTGKIYTKKALYYKTLKTTTKKTMPQRLLYLAKEIQIIIEEYKPIYISCEQLFYTSNKKGQRKKSSSILPTNMMTGIIYLLAGFNNLEVKSYVPGTVKKTITGNGRAMKDEIIEKIEILFKIKKGVLDEHQADAISIAYTSIIQTE